jgi:hypothetical protein
MEQGALRIAQPQQQQRRFSITPLMMTLQPPRVIARFLAKPTCLDLTTYSSPFQQLFYFNPISQYPNLTLTQTLAEPKALL